MYISRDDEAKSCLPHLNNGEPSATGEHLLSADSALQSQSQTESKTGELDIFANCRTFNMTYSLRSASQCQA